MDTILVQISDHHWTTQALHLACAMAHNTHSQLALLCLRAVRSPYLLGTEVGSIPPPKGDLEAIDAYRVIANGYGVEITLERMQYESLTDALIQAAEYTHASYMFAHIRKSSVPFWRKLQLWNLRHQLRMQKCQLYTLDEPKQPSEWVPSVTIRAGKRNRNIHKPAHI